VGGGVCEYGNDTSGYSRFLEQSQGYHLLKKGM
jgi:hypothetical protein